MKEKVGKKLKTAICAICALFLVGILPAGFLRGLNNIQVAQAATDVKINKTEETITVGDSAELEITGTSEKVKWESSNTKVATVSEWGTVRAKKKGVAQITATVGDKAYTCEVTVVEKPSINQEYIELDEGESYQLKIKNTNQPVTWEIYTYYSDYGCIKLSSSGKVTALDTGEAVVTAKVGNKKFECKIVVKPRLIKFNETKKGSINDIELDEYRFIIDKKQKVAITISSTEKNDPVGKLEVELYENKGYLLDPLDEQEIFFPYKTQKTLYYTLEPGEYYIYINDDNAIKSGLYEFLYGYTIKINTTSSKASTYELDETKLITQIGSSHQLLLINEKGSIIQRNLVSWKSSDTNIASVTSNGVVKGKKEGSCTITAQFNDGEIKTCQVTVGKPSLAVRLMSNPVYAYVSGVWDKPIYNDASIRMYNNSSKDIVYIEYEIIQYNSRKQYIESPYKTYYCDDTLHPNETYSHTFWVNDDAKYAIVCIKNVTYKDGKVWNNPYYSDWHKKYYKKNMQ